MASRVVLLLLLLALVALAAFGCREGAGEKKATRTATPRSIPSPAAVAQEPADGVQLGNPSFAPLRDAKADYGRLGGTVYQIEIPERWNGRLLLYLHGFQDLGPTAEVRMPSIRGYLIRNGWAWAASSYSSTGLIPGRAADESAALWDYFAAKHGRPQWTYILGESMGGAATAIVAERYPDRFDGALALCGFAGQTGITSELGDYFVAGAFVAGVTQADFDATLKEGEKDLPDRQTFAGGTGIVEPNLFTTPVGQLMLTQILPALKDPQVHKRFQDIMLDLTGGPRVFDREGFELTETTNWLRAGLLVAYRLYDNIEKTYKLGPLSDVSSTEFNAGAVRLSSGDLMQDFLAGNEFGGEIKIPLLTLHTTGDGEAPIDQEQVIRRGVEAAGKGDLLVQRIVRDPAHCSFTPVETETALEDVVAWVEQGEKPKGEDVLVDDLRDIGARFTLTPRLGSPEADEVPGADRRVVLRGALTLDGGAVSDGFIVALVRKDGFLRFCSYRQPSLSDGQYELAVAADAETSGCGGPGAKVYLALFRFEEGARYLSGQTLDWPETKETTFDASFTSARPAGAAPESSFDQFLGTVFYGTAVDAVGRPLPAATNIEAYIGATLCGRSAVPPVAMEVLQRGNYVLSVAGPQSIAACKTGQTVTFRVNGRQVPPTGAHDLAPNGHLLDLVVP